MEPVAVASVASASPSSASSSSSSVAADARTTADENHAPQVPQQTKSPESSLPPVKNPEGGGSDAGAPRAPLNPVVPTSAGAGAGAGAPPPPPPAAAAAGLAPDGSSRTAHVARARQNFGSSTPDFTSKCQSLLKQLSTCADIRQEYALATAKRQEMEKSLKVASTWVQVRKIEAATAKLKLARLQAEKTDVPHHKEALVEVAKCELRVKQLEEEVTLLKEKDATKKVVKARALELNRLTLLNEWNATIATVKEFPRVMAGAERTKFYFSYCNQEGHAPWYCEVLSKRPMWQEYPAVKWFTTKKGTQLYCPVGNVSVDYSDQHVYSRVTADMPGHENVTFKGKLAQLGLSCHPKSWHIVERKWVDERGGAPPAELDDGKSVWFLKDTLRNYSMGIELCNSPVECLAKAEADKTYVVQRQIMPYLVGPEKKKQHLRIYFAAMSAMGTPDIRFLVYHDGWLALTPKPYDPNGTDKDTQISRDRDCRLSEWEVFPSLKDKLFALIHELASKVRVKLRPEAKKHAFLLLGLDVMIDDQMELWLLECNAGPVIRRADYPMLESLLEMAIPPNMKPFPADEPIAPATHKGWIEVVLPPPSDAEVEEKAAAQAKADAIAARALEESVAAQKQKAAAPAAAGAATASIAAPAGAAVPANGDAMETSAAASEAPGSVAAAEALVQEMPLAAATTQAQREEAAVVAAAMANDSNNIYKQDESDSDCEEGDKEEGGLADADDSNTAAAELAAGSESERVPQLPAMATDNENDTPLPAQ